MHVTQMPLTPTHIYSSFSQVFVLIMGVVSDGVEGA